MTAALPKLPLIDFEPVGHTYSIAGRPVINVTRVLDRFNESLRMVPFPVLEAARELGTAVHVASALDDRGVLDEASCDAKTLAYLAGWRRFRDDTRFQPDVIEHFVYHPASDYCGTLDRGGMLAGKWVIADIKTGVASRFEGMQLAAYADAWHAAGGRQFEARYTVRLHPDFTRGYRLEPHVSTGDLPTWRSLLHIYRFLEKS